MPEKVITELTSNEKRLVQQFHADFQWFAEHSHELSMKYKGKVVAVAHQELFVADSWEEAMRLAKEKYLEAQPCGYGDTQKKGSAVAVIIHGRYVEIGGVFRHEVTFAVLLDPHS